MSDKNSRGRKAASSAEKSNFSVYDAVKDPDAVVHSPYGSAVTEEHKKDLFKRMNLIRTT